MKKTLLLSALAVAAFGAQAEQIVYDFYKVAPEMAVFLNEEGAIASKTNYDLIDKNGAAINFSGEQLTLGSKEEGWRGDVTKMIDLTDGALVNTADANPAHTLIGWGEKGPSRVLIMGGWGNEEGIVGGDYQAATEDDYIATKHALAFNRNSNSASREDTYLQIPAVQGPFTVDVYMGNAGGNYAKELRCKVVPVVGGVEQEATTLGKAEGEFTAKRMYKFTYSYDKTDAPLVRFGCDTFELNIYHLVVKTGADAGAGVENVVIDAFADDAPIYNTLGVQVDENYKGLVIKGGKKYIQK